jgi:hypothetical protein
MAVVDFSELRPGVGAVSFRSRLVHFPKLKRESNRNLGPVCPNLRERV